MPGRGNSPKTGNGIPSPLRQEIELTEKYEKGKKIREKNRAADKNPGGLNVNKATAEAAAKTYEKKFVENKRTGGASIIDGKGKTIATASSYGGGREVEALRKKFVKDSTDTMNRRGNNAEYYNAAGGGTSPDKLNTRQRQALIRTGKARISGN